MNDYILAEYFLVVNCFLVDAIHVFDVIKFPVPE